MSGRRERRQIQRQIGELLRSDLYERVRGVEGAPENSATWESPLGHRCTLGLREGIDPMGEGDQPLFIELVDSTGRLYASTDDGSPEWLEEEML